MVHRRTDRRRNDCHQRVGPRRARPLLSSRGKDRAALIDTGLGVGDLASVVRDLNDRPILVGATHAHWDHLGAHEAFDSTAVRDCLRNDATRPLPEDFDPDDYEVPTVEPTRIVEDGDEIDIGARHLRVLHTPGHSPGHCCLFDPIRGHLFASDFVYKGPQLLHYEPTDLEAFAESVRRIADLDGVERVLPWHHDLDLPADFPNRVRVAVDELDRDGQLHHGSGTHEFDGFGIVL